MSLMVVPDHVRALIADPDRYEPQASATLLDFAAHYATAVLPTRPYRPRDKAKVEQAALVVERWILARLRHRRFATLAEVDQAVAALLTEINARPFKRLPGCHHSAYEALDRPALRPLPVTRYELARYWPATVNIDYHIVYEQHYYSVPHPLVQAKVELRITRRHIEVLHRGKRVAAQRPRRLSRDIRGRGTLQGTAIEAGRSPNHCQPELQLRRGGSRRRVARSRRQRRKRRSSPRLRLRASACRGTRGCTCHGGTENSRRVPEYFA
jgi:hypothetical protein